MCLRGVAAANLLLNKDVSRQGEECARDMKLFEDHNFLVTVVFDGRPPPVKSGTSQHRRERRKKSAQQARALHDAGGCPVEINKLASAACAFNGRVTAEIATRSRALIRGEVYIAPGEADPQLVVFQDIHLATGANVYVYANDSDLTVLGVRDLLVEVVKNATTSRNSKMSDQLLPARLAFVDTESGVWAASLQPFDAVVGDLASRLLVESREEDTPAARREFEIRLRACHTMVTQPVVWDPLSGELQHLSGAPTREEITRHTGTLELSPLASRVARGDVCPLTGREWDPPLGTAQAKGQAVGEDAGRQKKRATPETASTRPPNASSRASRARGPQDTNNYREHGFSRLPGETEDYTKWTVPKLREFLSVFRCLDTAGTSGFKKALLAQMAGDVVRLIRSCGVLDTNLAFRHPVPDLSSFEEKEARLMPDLPATGLRIKEWSAMRRYLPEISKAVISRFLGEVNKLAGEGSRLWYRSLQRVLDMGNLSRFWAVPAAGGIMWIGTSAGASFSADKEYRVRIKLRVEGVDENAPPTEQEEKEGEEEEEVVGNDPRSAQTLVALEVIAALCECPAGIKGGCSHAAMALFLGRLLQMSEEQLATFNPTTCTGMACRWIMQHDR
ncbi:exonuclease I Exo1 [Ectocarpus siliculosus]|uniref:Exonuclease I Exo1 n=1 Tax=Ectocarpus siliculosus TaxID=2880 RepID=D7G671_ECTSI|nr:exonuclease I Exo1 [Ectocarpus siliculosus]|eukprot:CBJ33934.1 exonuclease I Exo1 [Ectocarpus siliculosus]